MCFPLNSTLLHTLLLPLQGFFLIKVKLLREILHGNLRDDESGRGQSDREDELLTKEHYYKQHINIVCCQLCFLSNFKEESDNRQM